MVQFQCSVVKVDWFVVRIPVPHHNQVKEAQGQHQVHSKLADFLNQNVHHQNHFDQKVKDQVHQNVPRLVIFSVRVVFVMFELLNRWGWCSRLFFFCQFGVLVVRVRDEDLVCEHEKCEKNDDHIRNKTGFFDEVQSILAHHTWPSFWR